MAIEEVVNQAEKVGRVVGLWVFIAFATAILFGFKRFNGKTRFKHGETELEYDPNATERPAETEKPVEPERPSLLHHRLFHILRNAQSPGFILCSTYGDSSPKCAINTAFVRDCKVKIFYDGLQEFFTNIEENDGGGLSKLPEKISALIDDYERAARRITIELPGGQLIVGVPNCYMRKFNNWHTPHVKLCLSGITEALDSRFYPDWWTRATVCMEYIAMAFDLTFEDAERTLGQLNGDLDREISEIIAGRREPEPGREV